MASEPRMHVVYKAINRPLTIWGVERGIFFLALATGGATFNFFGSLSSGLGMFLLLYVFGRWATATDPQVLRIVLNASKFRAQYDPAKRACPAGRALP
jgi:type IV secretory pathway TrbD component